MVKICPSCGTRAVDDQSLFCNKCGYPFPKEAPEKPVVVSRTAPRTPGVTEYPPVGELPPSRAPGKKPQQKKTGRTVKAPFKKFITRKYIRPIYFLGAIAIILVSLLGISAGFSTTGPNAANLSFTNTTALVENPSASPLFWIGFLILGSLVWRIFCELAAVVFRIYDAISGEEGALVEGGAQEYGEDWAEGMVECPRCGKVVPSDQLRECEHCGVQGCSNCIRMMGLVRKTRTCKDCFENT